MIADKGALPVKLLQLLGIIAPSASLECAGLFAPRHKAEDGCSSTAFSVSRPLSSAMKHTKYMCLLPIKVILIRCSPESRLPSLCCVVLRQAAARASSIPSPPRLPFGITPTAPSRTPREAGTTNERSCFCSTQQHGHVQQIFSYNPLQTQTNIKRSCF